MRLIVGLGNPGKQYEHTRHNVGFAVVRELARRVGQPLPRARFDGEWWETNWNGEKCLVGRPLTFMNRSGQSVLGVRDFYKIENEQILVICDDLALPVGKLRLRAKGSAGGQKGLDDILKRLGSDQIARLRVGIGAPPPGWDAADYVLGRFAADESDVVQVAVNRAADAAVDWVGGGIEFAMNKYN